MRVRVGFGFGFGFVFALCYNVGVGCASSATKEMAKIYRGFNLYSLRLRLHLNMCATTAATHIETKNGCTTTAIATLLFRTDRPAEFEKRTFPRQ